MIIGLSGRPGCGKSTVAAALLRRGFVELALADRLRKVAMRVTGLSFEDLVEHPGKDTIVPEFGKTPREITIEVGRAFDRFLGRDYLSNVIDSEMKKRNITEVVIPDIRTKAQAEWIKSKEDGILIRISSPEVSKYEIERELDDYKGFDITTTRDAILAFVKGL